MAYLIFPTNDHSDAPHLEIIIIIVTIIIIGGTR
jgi:hypothetical protein